MKAFAISLALLLAGLTATAQQSPAGVWKTIDDETGKPKSQVTIYEQNGKFYGKISEILTDRKQAVCDKCDGSKKDKPILGMVIIEGLKAEKDYWAGGTILDPNSGNTYKLSVWYEDGKRDVLKVRGKHWTGLYRTQTWYRVK